MTASDLHIGILLAVSSSVFIGASFSVKKKGLERSAKSGTRAGAGGHGYLKEPLWWAGLILMAVGEAANFAAYAYAPAMVVTPLGALSVLVNTAFAALLTKEYLTRGGMVGCLACLLGSTLIVRLAPDSAVPISSIDAILGMMMEPAFLLYVVVAASVSLWLILSASRARGTTVMFANLTICSLVGSLSVTGCKALGIALRRTFAGDNQLARPATWLLAVLVVGCIVVQMNHLNKALDAFNTATVTPVYYVMFTLCTITASAILYREWSGMRRQEGALAGGALVLIFVGFRLLHLPGNPR